MTATDLRDTGSFVYRFDADHDGAFWLARHLCEQWLGERQVRADAIPDLLLATTELCNGASGTVVLRIHVEGSDVEVVVESGGGVSIESPVGDLRLAAALCDELVLRVTPERSVALARRHGVVPPD
jgi:hypothetical protein